MVRWPSCSPWPKATAAAETASARPGGRPDQQVRSGEGDRGGEHQRQDNLEQQRIVYAPDRVPAHQDAGRAGAREAAHQGVRGRQRNAAPPRVDPPEDGRRQGGGQDAQAGGAVGQVQKALAGQQREAAAQHGTGEVEDGRQQDRHRSSQRPGPHGQCDGGGDVAEAVEERETAGQDQDDDEKADRHVRLP
jgi:hypothetical protein